MKSDETEAVSLFEVDLFLFLTLRFPRKLYPFSTSGGSPGVSLDKVRAVCPRRIEQPTRLNRCEASEPLMRVNVISATLKR
jgi:hypothetical protein